jgi:proteasome lid subunit RPN8/RPN11
MTGHGTLPAVLRFPRDILESMVAHCLDEYPLEACGLIGGFEAAGEAVTVSSLFPATNLAGSARVYELDPRVMLRADRETEESGSQVIGVYHSHTHTDAKPSPTDVGQAPDPAWHYVLVSLRDTHPSVRSWSIRDAQVQEEPVVLQW